MISRRVHKILGLVLVLPMLGWTVTGLVFFFKPGYESAYAELLVKTYPLDKVTTIVPLESWEELRIIKTILGEHLLVKSNGRSEHYRIGENTPREFPSHADFQALVNDALARNINRYGVVDKVTGNHGLTTTGVRVTLDWSNLKLSQYGSDRALIDSLYNIHYLQWTPWELVNRILGVVGLVLLFGLTVLGFRIYFKG